jgi:hypothetical protein
MREIEKIQQELFDYVMHEEGLILSWINQAYNLGLQDAADNVALDSTEEYNERKGEYYRDYFVDKESILKLKL